MTDYIDRQAAIDAINRAVTKEVARWSVEELPSAEVEPVRRGKWIQNDNGTYSCSLCQSWIPEEQHYYARFCLYCGAKMKEAMEGEGE